MQALTNWGVAMELGGRRRASHRQAGALLLAGVLGVALAVALATRGALRASAAAAPVASLTSSTLATLYVAQVPGPGFSRPAPSTVATAHAQPVRVADFTWLLIALPFPLARLVVGAFQHIRVQHRR